MSRSLKKELFIDEKLRKKIEKLRSQIAELKELDRKEGEQEFEEKLGSQKGLFYCKEPLPRAVGWKQIEGIEKGCIYFWGKENGRNYYLLVPDTHPDLSKFKRREKVKYKGVEGEYTDWTLKKQFYLIKGVDNLLLEATSSESHQHNVPNSWSKVVGLADRIKIASADSQVSQGSKAGEIDKIYNTPIKVWCRSSTIFPEMIGFAVMIHNGKGFIKREITENMVNYKLGMFAPTRHQHRKHGKAGTR